MDLVIKEIIDQWGVFGIFLLGFGWLVYDSWKNNKNRKIDSVELKNDIKKHVTTQIDIVDKKIDIVDKKVEDIDSNLNDRIDILSERVDSLPSDHVTAVWAQKDKDNKEHLKQIEDVMFLGGRIHEVLKEYIVPINADHIFIGSFHNGNANLSGIPFCKFDLISECYCENKVDHDHEFAPVYKDADILRYGSLFSAIFQNDHMLFIVDPDGRNDLAKHEDIIWRRMVGLGIKQMAIKVLRDPDNIPSGFLGAVRYDLNNIDMNALILCGKELEHIYSVNKYKKRDVSKE